eukprot:UN29511
MRNKLYPNENVLYYFATDCNKVKLKLMETDAYKQGLIYITDIKPNHTKDKTEKHEDHFIFDSWKEFLLLANADGIVYTNSGFSRNAKNYGLFDSDHSSECSW